MKEMTSPNFIISREVLDKATPYRATSSIFYGRLVCIPMAPFFYKSVQLLAYADDIDNIGHTMRDVTTAFSAIRVCENGSGGK